MQIFIIILIITLPTAIFSIEIGKFLHSNEAKIHSGEKSKQRVFDKKKLSLKEIYNVVVRLLGERCTFKPQIVNWINELQVG